MSRALLLIVPSCLAIIACAAPPPPPAGFGLLAQGQDAGRPTAANEGWTTGVYGSEQPRAGRTDRYDDDDDFDLDDEHITLLLGERFLDEDDWDPVEDQLAGGVEYDAYDHDTGNGFEVGGIYSQNDDEVGGVDVDAYTAEAYGGFRHTFNPDDDHDGVRRDRNGDGVVDDRDDAYDDDDDLDVHPYLSAGLAVIRAEVDTDPGSGDDDTSPGAYLRAGLAFDVGDSTRLGLDYRHMFLTDVDIGPIGDVDYDQLMLTLGFAF